MTANYLRAYDFTDGSSNYTITIKNDLGFVNGLPGQRPPDSGMNFIHTWLIITDTSTGETIRYSLSFSATDETQEKSPLRIIVGDLYLEDYVKSIADFRTTEEFTFNISDDDSK